MLSLKQACLQLIKNNKVMFVFLTFLCVIASIEHLRSLEQIVV